jgi:hypothetical protein
MCITVEIAPHLEDKHFLFTQSLLEVWKILLVSASNIVFSVMFLAHQVAWVIYATSLFKNYLQKEVRWFRVWRLWWSRSLLTMWPRIKWVFSVWMCLLKWSHCLFVKNKLWAHKPLLWRKPYCRLQRWHAAGSRQHKGKAVNLSWTTQQIWKCALFMLLVSKLLPCISCSLNSEVSIFSWKWICSRLLELIKNNLDCRGLRKQD